ncbi:colanic acid biosynthesis acetyltransferase WcaF [Maribellus sediminis]|uniref:colanic acid biosynthesis acetyltransferase WcaF n=1 Tax=Maribellus sediminis TaxID=2696285 RepID=UPI0014311601|nr:colanic acid biosynthesis acetyltransferase WcaF [Maribellus sediminis]
MQESKYQSLQKYSYHLERERSKIFILIYNLVYGLFIRYSPRPFFEYRNWIYRAFGAEIGKKVRISSSAKLYYPWNIQIGNYCWIGDNCNLYSIDKIKIGDNVALAHNIFISTASHDVAKINFPTIRQPVVLEDEVWIASNAFINMGVTIHRGAVIGSCAVVTKDMPEGYICLGFPAKPIKIRNSN